MGSARCRSADDWRLGFLSGKRRITRFSRIYPSAHLPASAAITGLRRKMASRFFLRRSATGPGRKLPPVYLPRRAGMFFWRSEATDWAGPQLSPPMRSPLGRRIRGLGKRADFLRYRRQRGGVRCVLRRLFQQPDPLDRPVVAQRSSRSKHWAAAPRTPASFCSVAIWILTPWRGRGQAKSGM